MEELFDKEIFSMTVEDLLDEINSLLEDSSPEGKSVKDFTGGYVQQLKNSTQLVLYYGTKTGDKNKNRDTVKVHIEQDEVDQAYMMLKCKIHDMRSNGAKVEKTSLAQRRLAKKKEEDIF